MIHCRRAATREIVLGVLALTALAGTVLLYFRSGAHTDVPADKFLPFHCTKCNYDFQLSYRELVTQTEKRQYTVGDGRQTLFKCPKCGQLTAEQVDAQTPPNKPASESP
mgnify:CR=1 FL=1